MNRRGFLARSAAVLGGLMASCQFMPELATAQTKREGQERSIFEILAEEMQLAKRRLPPKTVLDNLHRDQADPFLFRVNLAQLRNGWIDGNVIELRFHPLWTETQIRRHFRIELSRALMAFVDRAGADRPTILYFGRGVLEDMQAAERGASSPLCREEIVAPGRSSELV